MSEAMLSVDVHSTHRACHLRIYRYRSHRWPLEGCDWRLDRIDGRGTIQRRAKYPLCMGRGSKCGTLPIVSRCTMVGEVLRPTHLVGSKRDNHLVASRYHFQTPILHVHIVDGHEKSEVLDGASVVVCASISRDRLETHFASICASNPPDPPASL